MRLVLAASDLTDRGNIAVIRAGQIAAEQGAALRILHVIDGDLPDSQFDQVLEMAAESLGRLERSVSRKVGATVSSTCRTGDPWRAILDDAEQCDPDLLVLGTHRYAGFRDLFVGTTVERIAKRAARAILLARNSPHQVYRRVLVATNFSLACRQALTMALEIAPDARIEVLHVMNPRLVPSGGPARSRDEVREAEFEMRTFLGGLERPNVVSRIEQEASASDLRTIVTRVRPDLLVLGAHSRSGRSDVLLGSHAHQFLASPVSDVLVVPPARNFI